MLIHGTGSRRSLLNSLVPSEPRVYSVVLVFYPINATDPDRLPQPWLITYSAKHDDLDSILAQGVEVIVSRQTRLQRDQHADFFRSK
jgi:hypothetical protein